MPLDTDQVLASAVRYLIDGQELDHANLLLSCDLRVDRRVETGDGRSRVWLSLAGPRVVFESITDGGAANATRFSCHQL
jgi:hypothetical protein